MRGDDQQQNHIFSYLSPEARVRKHHPLRAIRVMVDEVRPALATLRYAIAGGLPPALPFAGVLEVEF